MKIALAQINTTVGDLRGNTAKIVEFYRRGAASGVDLVMTPELAITGYLPTPIKSGQTAIEMKPDKGAGTYCVPSLASSPLSRATANM
jgi:predicted amidohydrolase